MISICAAMMFIASHFLDNEYFLGSKQSNSVNPINPLLRAAMLGNCADVEVILRHGRTAKERDPNSQDGEGMSPLHWASLRGYVNVTRKLLEFGADVHSVDISENTPLHLSALSGNRSVVILLLLSGCSVNALNEDGDTALHLAVMGGVFDVVETLLSHGASTNATNNQGKNALDLAIEEGRLAITKLLKSVGATVSEVRETEEDLFGRNETYNRGLYRWENEVNGEQIPKDAVVGGTDMFCEKMYVGRTKHGAHLLPAKVCPMKKFAFYSYDDKEFYTSKYQVLCSENIIWKPLRYGEVPSDAFVAGKDANGENLYIGRTFLQFKGFQLLTPGKVVPSENMLYTSYHYHVYQTSKFEILIVQ